MTTTALDAPARAPASRLHRTPRQGNSAPAIDATSRPSGATQDQLAEESFRIALGLMEKHGNTLSTAHVEALRQLAALLARSAFEPVGRVAVGLGTGLGKTTSVAAFVAALHRLGLDSVAVSVSSSQVAHLCDLYASLGELGIPDELLGLKHSKGDDAAVPSKDDLDGRYQLVTHARARSKRGHHVRLVTRHLGQPRRVIIWDESLIRADSKALPLVSVLPAIDASARTRKDAEKGSTLALALGYIEECRPFLEAAEKLTSDDVGSPLHLPRRSIEELEAYADAVRRLAVGGEQLCDLLQVSQAPLRVLVTKEGGAVLWAEVAVPTDLRDVVVLDASYSVRELCKLDPTITEVRVAPEDVKTFERVNVTQVTARGSRSALVEGLRVEKGQRAGLVAREVASILRECLADPAAKVLVFTFKDRRLDKVKTSTALQAQVRTLMMGSPAERTDLAKRVRWQTWGNELGVNGYSDATHVVLAGVILRDLADLAAAARGQVGDLDYPTPYPVLEELRQSEAAAACYQALSRGQCRQVEGGSARQMTAYIIHRDLSLEGRLRRVMLGVQWAYRDPLHMPTANRGSVSQTLDVWLRGHLRAYFSDRGRLIQADRGRRFNAIVDGRGCAQAM